MMTSVGCLQFQFLNPIYLFFVTLDWSEEQIDKHRKEIQSLLGNLFLRITSIAIQTRILSVQPRTLAEISKDEVEGSPNRLLLNSLFELPDKFKTSMDNLEVSDALKLIIDVLRMVRLRIPMSFVLDPDIECTDRPTKRCMTLPHGVKPLLPKTRTLFTPSLLKLFGWWQYACSHSSRALHRSCWMHLV